MTKLRGSLILCLCVSLSGCGSPDEEPSSCPPSFCSNGGTCVDEDSSFTCECADGFTGEHCDTNIDDCAADPCQNGGTCVDGVASFTCECADGFTGEHCDTNIDECATDPCQNGGTCVDGVASFTCECVGAWEGDTCETCAGPIDHTASFIDQSPQTTATIDLGDFSISGSANVLLASGGLSIQGGTANLRIDSEEYITFSFSAPVTQVSYVVNEVTDYDNDTIAGTATLEAFASNGQSLGSPTSVSGLGSKDVSAAVGGQRLQELIIRAVTDGHRLESLTYRGCL